MIVALGDGKDNVGYTLTPAEIQAKAAGASIYIVAIAVGGVSTSIFTPYLPTSKPAGAVYSASNFDAALQAIKSSVINKIQDPDNDGAYSSYAC